MKMKALAMILAALLALSSLGALAEGTMTVQGVGVVRVDADRASISLGVREVSADVATAQSVVNERMDALIAALKDIGVGEDSLSTGGIGIYPNYDYSEDERIVGYTAYNSIVAVISDVQNVGAYIDAAFAAGANSLDYVSFAASDTAEAADKALELAVDSAKERAEVLAQAAGVKLGDILEIRDGGDGSVGYYDAGVAYARTEDAASGTQVLAESQSVTANVSITFAIGE